MVEPAPVPAPGSGVPPAGRGAGWSEARYSGVMLRALRWTCAASLLALAAATGAGPAATGATPGPSGADPVPRAPTRVILFVADGAGVAYWSAALFAADSLSLGGFPVVGLIDPRSTSGPIPESASSATALATGVQSYSRAVGVGPDSLPRTTVLETAERAGLATGLVTTTHLIDATPAAFAAHVPDRRQGYAIARQIAGGGIEVLLGDGRAAFDPATRPDSLNLVATLRRDHVWVEDPAALTAVAAADSVRALVGLFALDREHHTAARRPSLAEMTAAALEVLDRDPDGFFLLVENEHSDHFGHANLPLADIVAEILHLDEAIRVALEYRAESPATLIIVLGDHETGGLDVVADSTGALAAAWSTTGHTGELVPVFAIGPGAERFGGIRTGAQIGRALLEAVAAPSASSERDD
jgi:alkaline phosphatase